MRKKIMRIFNTITLAALSLVLSQCAVQEMEAPHQADASFEVYAIPSDTRTVNDGVHTLWSNGDRFTLFHAASTRTQSFYLDGAFTVDEPATGHALGSIASLNDGTYNWYMAYPYSEKAERPTDVPVIVGASAGTQQVQNGNDSRAHLAGEGFPVAGRALGVSTPDTPVLTAAPMVSVLAVNVTNPGEGVAKITSVSFKAPEAIVGSFSMDITGDTPVFRAEDASDEARLSVTGSILRAGESAVFYLGIKPFTAPSGSTLTLAVNDQVRTVTLTRDVTFSAGRIKTLNMTLDESEPSSQFFFKRVNALTSGRKYIMVAEDANQGGLRMACPLPEGTDFGRMPVETVSETEDGVIALDATDNVFIFTEAEKGYTIRQRDGRYLYNSNKDDVYVGTEPGASYYWTVSFDENDLANIVNSSRHLQYNPTSSVQKFQVRQTSSSVGKNPWLYELQNDDEMAVEFLQKTLPGVYGYNGFDWTYADGISQTSVRTLSGKAAFRIFYPDEFMVIQLTGIPAEPALNDRFPVRFVRYVKQAATHADDFTVTVVKVENGKAWLMADGGTGFLVQTK